MKHKEPDWVPVDLGAVGSPMNEIISYKPNLNEVLQRLRLLYSRCGQDRIFATMKTPNKKLEKFQREHSESFCEYPDPCQRIEFWDAVLRENIGVDDDAIPSVYLSEFDQGLYGGLLGGDIRFLCHPENGWISSMVPPLLNNWSEFYDLKFDEFNPWWHRYINQLKIFAKETSGKFGISHFILIDGLNFVFELRGATKTYTDLIDMPDKIHEAIEFAFNLNVKVQDTFFKIVPDLLGGTCSNMVQWIPGKIVSESVDPFHMTSVDYFEKWGREPIERIFRHFDGGVLHIHGNGRHLLPAVSSLKGLKAIFLGDDRGFPLAFDILGKLKAGTKSMSLVVEVDFEKFKKSLDQHKLPGGVFYQVKKAPDIYTANRYMEKVRSYRL